MADMCVESWHINVGTGDSAIHLLLDKPSNQGGTIQRACLVDGGLYQNVGSVEIAIKTIQNQFKISQLRFDSVVVTHWDSDHYQGIVALINLDFIAQLRKLGYDNLAKMNIPFEDVAKFRCNYFKYQGSDLLTTLYAPYWYENAQEDFDKEGPPPATEQRRPDRPKDLQEKDGMLNFGLRASKGKPLVRASERKQYFAERICLVKYTREDLIGVNFFDNRNLLKGTHYKKIKTPDQLAELMKPMQTPVALVCVASLNAVIGEYDDLFPVRSRKPVRHKPRKIGPDVYVVDRFASKSNRASIAAVILWQSGRVSHYVAGDAEYQSERAVAKWLGKSTQPNFQVPSMKLSHHGSDTSTPMDLLSILRPKNIVLSAGKHPKYFHPAWLTLMYLNAWLLSHDEPRPLVSTRFPFYCEKFLDVYAEFASTFLHDFMSGEPLKHAAINAVIRKMDEAYDQAYRQSSNQPKLIYFRDQAIAWYQNFVTSIPDGGGAKARDWTIKYNCQAWMSWQIENAWRGCLSPQYPTDDKLEQPLAIVIISVEDRAKDGQREIVASDQRSPLPNTPATAAQTVRHSVVGSGPAVPQYSNVGPSLSFAVLPDHLKSSAAKKAAQKAEAEKAENEVYASRHGQASNYRPLSPAIASKDDHPMVPVMPGPVLPPIEEGWWYAWSGGEEDPSIDKINPNDPLGKILDPFVRMLHGCMFGVVSTQRPPEGSSVKLLDKDVWRSWMVDAAGITDMSVQTSATSGMPELFSISMAGPGQRGSIIFATDKTSGQFTSQPPETISTLGITPGSDSMIFSLAPDGPSLGQTTLSEVFSFAKLDQLMGSPLYEQLGKDVKLSLCTDIAGKHGARNAVWFEPAAGYRTTVRLQWKFDQIDIVNKILEALECPVPLKSAFLVTRTTGIWRTAAQGILNGGFSSALVVVHFDVEQSSPFFNATATLDFSPMGVSFSLKFRSTTNALAAVMDWLGNSLGLDDSEFQEIHTAADQFLDALKPRELSLQLQANDHNVKPISWRLAFEVDLKVGGGPVCLLTYASSTHQLTGRLWTLPEPSADSTLRPEWEESLELLPLASSSKALDLNQLLSDYGEIPQGLPSSVSDVSIRVDKSSVVFAAEVECPDRPDDPVPSVQLDTVSIYAEYSFVAHFLTVQFNFDLELMPEYPDIGEPAVVLSGEFDYDGDAKLWRLQASLNAVTLADLYYFFHPQDRTALLDVLGRIRTTGLDLDFYYEKGLGSKFTFSGGLQIGQLELLLAYDFTKDGWQITASLGAASTESTLGLIIASLIGPEDCDFLPDFIQDIPISPAKDEGAVKLHCSRLHPKSSTGSKDSRAANGDTAGIFFSVALNVEVSKDIHLRAMFIQYRPVEWELGSSPWRILTFGIQTPSKLNIDFLGDIPRPFDEVRYLWIRKREAEKAGTNRGGLKSKEVDAINQELEPETRLLFRQTAATKPENVVLPAGSHFQLVISQGGERRAIVDYPFIRKSKQQLSALRTDTSYIDPPLEASGSSSSDGQTGSSTMAPYKKTAGPISISNIGIKFKEKKLIVILDASFNLGPLGVTFIDAGIGVEMKKHILDIGADSFHFQVSGLAVEFSRPPLVLAGALNYIDDNKVKGYAGGIIVGFKLYKLTAAGFYGTVTLEGDKKGFTSVFVFARLEGPLMTLEFAEISGITGGFGYNSAIKLPEVTEIPDFPFIKSDDLDTKPMNTLQALVKTDGTGWFSPRDGSFWLAAGMQVSAFETLAINAVLVVSWQPKVQIGVFGVAVGDIPKGSSLKFAHVELGIAMTVDVAAGVLKFEAQLAPKSFVFHPSCRLTGGFALYYWFQGSDLESPHAGDWVFTIGGYHRAYQKPVHYPSPPRLAITWRYDSDISITGEAYFAITPKCCMAGGKLSAVYDTGSIRAWFDAWADFFINYKPFYFMADIGVSIGARVNVDIGITTLHFSGHVEASLELAGPPIHGVVSVKVLVITIRIRFGTLPDVPKAVSLKEFYNLARQAGTQAKLAKALARDIPLAGGAQPDPSEQPEVVDEDAQVFNCLQGLVEGKGDDSNVAEHAPWDVRSGKLVFTIDSRFAVKTATISAPSNEAYNTMNNTSSEDLDTVTHDEDIYAKPMQLQSPLDSSTMTITISAHNTASYLTPEAETKRWKINKIVKPVPSALWAIYDPGKDPQKSGSNVDDLMKPTNQTRNLMMGVEVISPDPTLSQDKILKFNAAKAMQMQVTIDPEKKQFPESENQDTRWKPAIVDNPTNQWTKVAALWKKSEQAAGSEAVKCLPEILHWKDKLVSRVPKRLLNDFGNLYMAAPMVSSA